MRKIFLVDDDADDMAIITDAMSQLDSNQIITYAQNGEAAMNLLLANADNNSYPCLIVLDLNMPKMNGTNTLKNIRKDDRFKGIPVVIYSTSINPLEKEACMSLGAHSFITKPVSFKESIDTAKLFLKICGMKILQ